MPYRLEQADLPLRTAEVMYIQMGASLFLGVVGRVALGLNGFFVLLPLGLGVAILVPLVRHAVAARMRERLAAAGAEVGTVLELRGAMRLLDVFDPDGNRIEAVCHHAAR